MLYDLPSEDDGQTTTEMARLLLAADDDLGLRMAYEGYLQMFAWVPYQYFKFLVFRAAQGDSDGAA